MQDNSYPNIPPYFEITETGQVAFWSDKCAILTEYASDIAIGTVRHQLYFAFFQGKTLADYMLERLENVSPHIIALTKNCWIQTRQTVNNSPAFSLAFHLPKTQRIRQYIFVLDQDMATVEVSEDYKTLAENIGDGFLLNQSDHLILVNKAFTNLLGYDQVEDLIGKHIAELIEPSQRELFMERHHNKLSGGNFETNTWPHLTRTGEIVWLEGHPKRILWKGKHAILSTLVNVTETYQREQQMQKEAEQLRTENTRLRYSLKNSYNFQQIIGKSIIMQKVYDVLLRAANDTANVIIYGESGTGKELAAQAIHSLGQRSQEPFVTVNCGAIPSELLESEFFGVKKGAFTGAYTDKTGYIEQACHGTLFLDEVGELPLNLQVKLLRALDTGTYSPVGSPESKKSDIRIVAATNRNLVAEVAAGAFREDLFYRLHVIPVYMPPLRERKDDIPLLLEYFASKYAKESLPIFPRQMLRQLYAYSWPGNVREFSNTIQRYMTLGRLDLIHGSENLEPVDYPLEPISGNYHLQTAINQCERSLIAAALQACANNRSEAAKLLGISRRSLYRKLGET